MLRKTSTSFGEFHKVNNCQCVEDGFCHVKEFDSLDIYTSGMSTRERKNCRKWSFDITVAFAVARSQIPLVACLSIIVGLFCGGLKGVMV